MEKLTNQEILSIYLNNNLIEDCVKYQFAKIHDPWKNQFSGDMFNDLIVIILEYDNDKLNNAHKNKHMNAWLTRVLQNNLMSDHSNFYLKYIKTMQHYKPLEWINEPRAPEEE